MKLVAILALSYILLAAAIVADLFWFNPNNLALHSALFGIPLLILSFRSRPAVVGPLSLAIGLCWFGGMVFHDSGGSKVAVLDDRLFQIYPLALLTVLALISSARGQARRDRDEQAEALARVAGVLERKATRDDVAAETVAVGQQLLGASLGLLWLTEPDGRSLRLVVDHGIGPRTRPGVAFLSVETLASLHLASIDASVEIADVHRCREDLPFVRQLTDAEGMTYVWLQSLASPQHLVGVLALMSVEPYQASRQTKDYLQALGRLAVIYLLNKPDLPYRPLRHIPMRRGAD